MTDIRLAGKFPAWRDDLVEGVWDTPTTALKAAGLNYQMMAAPIPDIVFPDGTSVPVPDKMALVRGRMPNDPQRHFIDIVSANYQVIQHSQFAGMMTKFAEASEKPIVMIGASGGHKTRLIMGFDFGEFCVKGWDTELVRSYFYTWNANDGGTSLGGMVSQVRMACLNQMAGAWKTAAVQFKVRHSGDALLQTEQWINYLGKVQVAVATQRHQLDRLAEIPVRREQVLPFMHEVYPLPRNRIVEQYVNAPEQESLPAQVQRNRDALEGSIARMERYRVEAVESYDRIVDEFPHIGGTAWALLNAVTENETWRPNGRGNGSRTESALFGDRRQTSERAFSLALALG